MTSRMVRCRSVSDDFTECKRPAALADEVSLLSLMALNVAARDPRIKHVFDRRVAPACLGRFRLSMDVDPTELQMCNSCGYRVFVLNDAPSQG